MVLPHSGFLKGKNSTGSLEYPQEEWSLNFWQLVDKVERIQSRLQPSLISANTIRDGDRVRKGSRNTLKFLIKNTECLKKDLKLGYIRVATNYYRPVKLIETKLVNSHDTQENRFLRWVLTRIREKLYSLKFSCYRKRRTVEQQVHGNFVRMERALGRLLRAESMTDVGELYQVFGNQVLQMSPSYQDVYRIYLKMI
ncbi:hypothetical protein UF75_0526 [Desulfosporosinus sp. I2]|uniref:DUF2357 domain-containing protein n=1 Tax=Desulfosporosinus sp. I2 TaxID=1617025 RepID=UPI0005EEEA07|nr:DUF2357 domain-containing protein [Desulfosporosinus sp. I2]KJR49011.1 hypothetical protein UF75_0526 [Desulfosporosinus sp. I2]